MEPDACPLCEAPLVDDACVGCDLVFLGSDGSGAAGEALAVLYTLTSPTIAFTFAATMMLLSLAAIARTGH